MRGPVRRRPRTVRLAVPALALLLAAVAVARGMELAGGDPLTTRGEGRWYGWAQRQPAMTVALEDVAGRVPAGARVEWVVPPDVDRRWLEIMAFYHLPSAWTVGVRPRGTPPPREVRSGRAGVTHRVHLFADGTAGVRPLPPSVGGPPPVPPG